MPRPSASVCMKSSRLSAGSPKNLLAALLLEREQVALDGADAGGGDVAVLRGELRGVLADELEHRAQVLEIEQEQAVVVGDLEDEVQDAFLRVVEIEHAGEEQRAHLADRGADGMAACRRRRPRT